MAIEKDGNKTYANITDLPSLDDINNGDKFLIQTPTGTTLLDFSSFLITLNNTTFQSQFNEMWDSFSASEEQLNTIGTTEISVKGLDSDKLNLCDAVNQLDTNNTGNYNELASYINVINNLINLNPGSFPILPAGVTFPIPLVPTKS